MPNSCSAPRYQTGYYNDYSGVPIFQMPSTQESIDIWKCFIHREGKLTKFHEYYFLLNIQQTHFHVSPLKIL